MVPSGVWFCTPAAGGWDGAFECVVAKLLAVVALGVLIAAEAAFKAVGRGEGAEA